MDVLDAIKERRSIRRFKGDPVEIEVLSEILEAGKWAPSAGNLQDRSIVIVKSLKTKKKLAMAAAQSFVAKAPVVLVVCAKRKVAGSKYGPRGARLYAIQDTAAMVQNMMLAAYSMDVGSCWVGAFNEDYVRRIIRIPKGTRPVAMVLLGYYEKTPKAPEKHVEIHMEKWQEKEKKIK